MLSETRARCGLTLMVAVCLALTLGSCRWLPKQSEFERVGEGRSLEVPPDLDAPDTTGATRVPNATYSAVRGGFVEDSGPAALTRPKPARLIEYQGGQVLALENNLDEAWRRVGVALERSDLEVEDSDPAARQYRVVYVDRRAREERPGRFSRWILRRKGPTDYSGTYEIRLEALEENLTAVDLLGADGEPPPLPVKDRILTALRDSLG